MTDFADVSSYQAGADLAAYAAAGHDRILIKATEGTSYTNPYFAGWWLAAGRLGLARGAYHYATPSRSAGAAEADRFAAVVQAAGGLGPRDWVCLDAEDPKDTSGHAAAHAAELCRRLAAAHGMSTGLVYTGTWWAGPAGLTAEMLPPGWRRLHLSDYGHGPDEAMRLPPGWARDQVVVRQYASTASQPGIPGPSDRNRVLREWLPTVHAEEVTVVDVVLSPEQLAAIADEFLGRIWEQMCVRPEKAAPDWHQPLQRNAADVWRRTYEVEGDNASRLVQLVTDVAAGRAEAAVIRQALATMVDPSHPAADILATPPAEPVVPTVAEIVAAVQELDMAGAIQVAHAATAQAVAHIPTPNPKETPDA